MKKLSLIALFISASIFAAQGTITINGNFLTSVKNFTIGGEACPDQEDLSNCIASLDTMTFGSSNVALEDVNTETSLARYFAVRASANFIAYNGKAISVLASNDSVLGDVKVNVKYLRYVSGGNANFGTQELGPSGAGYSHNDVLFSIPAVDVINGTDNGTTLATNATAQVIWDQAADVGAFDKVYLATGSNEFVVEAIFEVVTGDEATEGAYSANVNFGFEVL